MSGTREGGWTLTPNEEPCVVTPRVSKVPGLTCWESRYAPDQDRPCHAHERISINLVLQGSLIERCEGRSSLAVPGTLLFLPPGCVHANRILGAGARLFEVRLEESFLQHRDNGALPLDTPAFFPGGPASALALRLSGEAKVASAASHLVMEGIILEILGEIALRRAPQLRRRPPRWLLQARELLENRFAESLTLEEVAAASGVHPAHLASVYRAHYGCTVGDTVRRLRINYACREIARSKTPLAEIALDAGFANQSHFTRVFKRLMGLTPAEYRRAFSSP